MSLRESSDAQQSGLFRQLSSTLENARATMLFLFAQTSMIRTDKIATNGALFLHWSTLQDPAFVNDPARSREVSRKFKHDRDHGGTFLDGFPREEWFVMMAKRWRQAQERKQREEEEVEEEEEEEDEEEEEEEEEEEDKGARQKRRKIASTAGD